MQKPVVNSLEYRLAGVVSLGLLVFSLVIGSISFYLDYQSQIAASAMLQSQLVRAMQSQAEVAAFAGNAEIANDVIEGLMTHESIASVRLSAGNGFERQRRRTETPDVQLASTVYPLQSPVDKRARIGELQVGANEALVRDIAVQSALFGAVRQVLQILLTALLLALVFRRVVAKPISRLAQQLAAIQPGADERLKISPRHVHDEIGMLSSSANSLLDAVKTALEEERQLRFKIEEMEQHYRRIFESTNVGIMVLQADGRLINSNPILLQRIVGIHFNGQYTPDSEDFISAIFAQPEQAWAMVNEASQRGQAVANDLQLKSSNDEVRWAHCILSVSHDDRGQMDIIEGVLYDVTSRRQQEDAARQRAEIDALTGVHNRHGSELFINRSLRHANDDELAVGVLMIDLDGFKAVNDTYGHAAGDVVLVEVARRLRACLRRATDLVGRLGGDEFVVVAYNCGDSRTLLAQIATDIVAALSRPVSLPNGAVTRVGASIGIARFPVDGTSCEALLAAADLALYEVKRHGKNGYAFARPPGADPNVSDWTELDDHAGTTA